MSDRMNRHTF